MMIGPSEIGLEQEKALAAKALAALGKTTFTYGTPTGLNKPVLGKPGPNPSALDQLKRALTAKADTGDAKAQVALGRLYDSGKVGQDGKVQHDYAGAAYWYHQASDHGDAQAAYELAILYRDGLGVTADADGVISAPAKGRRSQLCAGDAAALRCLCRSKNSRERAARDLLGDESRRSGRTQRVAGSGI